MFLAKKHKRILSREVHFCPRIWSVLGYGRRAGTETCDYGNVINGDEYKVTCPYGETSNNICFLL